MEVADSLLADEPHVDLAEWPEPRQGINLPPEVQSCTGPLLALVDFVATCATPPAWPDQLIRP